MTRRRPNRGGKAQKGQSAEAEVGAWKELGFNLRNSAK